MSISSDPFTSRSINGSEFRSSLPPYRRWLAMLNRQPTVDAQIRTLKSENKRLAALESSLVSLLLSADSPSQTPPGTDCSRMRLRRCCQRKSSLRKDKAGEPQVKRTASSHR